MQHGIKLFCSIKIQNFVSAQLALVCLANVLKLGFWKAALQHLNLAVQLPVLELVQKG